uniref:RHD domain-containing protein n=1 Tax=Mola mola TaxID=94237 RepID=A0A3Q3XEX9_MOLML
MNVGNICVSFPAGWCSSTCGVVSCHITESVTDTWPKTDCVCIGNYPICMSALLSHLAGPDPDVRTPPTSAPALNEQPVIQELQSHPARFATADQYQHVDYQTQRPEYRALENPRAFDCPSIQITSIAPTNHVEPGCIGGAVGGYPELSRSRGQLYLPLDPCYRDTALSPSPCSSLSSRSWMSDLSSCESFSHVYDDVEGELRDAARLAMGSPLGSPMGSPGCGGGAFGVELWQQKYQHPLPYSPALSPHQSPRQSPCHSPRTSVTEESWLHRRPTSRPSSRPTSPCGKRRHSSADPYARSPSPHHSPSPTPGASPRGSVTDDTWVGSPAGILGSLFMSGFQELDVPSKTRRTSGSQLGLLASKGDPGLEPFQDSPAEEAREQDGLAELFLQVPSHFSWNKPRPGNPPLFRASSPPPLDWPLPNQFEQCELKLEVQPRSYHRAHYETEGSRGSIKAAPAGHPVVKLTGYSEQPVSLQLFIGTADDRYLRPHAFYQVHRVTGKMVTTSCQEKIMGCTKVLDIPLLPENDMAASIDCNTRVKVVFRVAVPQPDGRMLWLQTSSVPVECSQRSGQELPQVESFTPASCSVDGGQELLITGSNISAQSRVVFTEKGPDGRSMWEIDARVVPEKSSGSNIVVEVPPYCKKTKDLIQVQFYISNGKRRRSQAQSFTYLPAVRRHLPAGVKQERWKADNISHKPPGLSCQVPSRNHVISPDGVYYDSCDVPVHCGPPSQSMPRLPHPPPSLMYPHTSSSSSAPHQTFVPLQTAVMPIQISTMPPQASSGGPQREPSPSLSSRRAFETPADPLKDSLLSTSGEVLSIKQEPEDLQPNLGSLGLQEITLDDGRKPTALINEPSCCCGLERPLQFTAANVR